MLLGEARRVAVFGMVGVVNTGVDFAVFLTLVEGGAAPLAANAVGFGTGACVSYLLNGAVTFRSKTAPLQLRSWGRVARFAAVTAACLGVSSLVLAAGLQVTTALGAKVLATGATFIAGYALNRLFVFGPERARA